MVLVAWSRQARCLAAFNLVHSLSDWDYGTLLMKVENKLGLSHATPAVCGRKKKEKEHQNYVTIHNKQIIPFMKNLKKIKVNKHVQTWEKCLNEANSILTEYNSRLQG